MSVLAHDVNAGGLACIQINMKGTTTNSLFALELILEHCIRLIALTRNARKYLDGHPPLNSPQPAILKGNPFVVKALRGESVPELFLDY